jgi:general secretion pathway protein D
MLTSRFIAGTLIFIAISWPGTVLNASELAVGQGQDKPANTAPAVAEPRLVRGSGIVIAPPKDFAAPAGSPSAFRFEDAPIADVVRLVFTDIMRVDYVLHPPITGTVTMATRGEISADQATLLLEGALQANGLLMARDASGVYHVGRPDSLKGIVAAPRQTGNGPLPPGYGTVIVPLQFIGAPEMAAILRPIAPPEAIVRVDALRNLLILVGTRTQVEGWMAMVHTFDVDMLKGMSVGVYPLKYASTKDVEEAIRLISGAPATANATNQPGGLSSTGATASAASLASAAAGAFLGAVRVLPIERINSILVVTPHARYLDQAKQWIERLDQPSNTGEPQLFVYPVQNGSAKHLASVLSGLFGNTNAGTSAATAQPTTGVAPGLGVSTASTTGTASMLGGVGGTTSGLSGALPSTAGRTTASGVTTVNLGSGLRVIADEINNAVLIYGDKRDYNKIESALRRLDLPPTQVLIEASIVEVTLSDDLQYGLQWMFNDSQRTAGALSGAGVLSTSSNGALGGALAGFSYTLTNPLGNIRAVLNALAGKSLVKVISSPSLMVLDNHTAAIAVGNQQPVLSGTTVTTGGNVSSSIQYKDTGVNLAVTPSVNAGNIVTMQINQAVTDVGQVDSATGQRAFLQRQISSKVAVRSGEAIVLGGLIRDNTTTGKSGLPLLQDIPIFGNLFGTNSKNTARTELLVVITPRVVRSDQDVREVSSEMRDRMKSFEPMVNVTAPAVSTR